MRDGRAHTSHEPHFRRTLRRIAFLVRWLRDAPCKKLYSLPNFLMQSGTQVPESGKLDSCPAPIAAPPDISRQLKVLAYSGFKEWPKAAQFCP